MEILTKVTYKTTDGLLFEDQKEAEKHEKELNDVKVFKIYSGPDLTEGRHGPEFTGYLLIHANNNHDMFAENWCYNNYGNKVAFTMGVYGSNAILYRWRFQQCALDQVEPNKVIARLEEDFVTKLWDKK
ncbi:MAG TPA: hypothetical protein VK190_03610 [Pseudoneobacillus sp.]|nr:hypothetical protein [Pseudoneobacillus sp.]